MSTTQRIRMLSRTLGLVTSLIFSGALMAQANWPERPIRIVVPSTPGGPTDVAARMLGLRIQSDLHQSLVVENRAGGGGLIGIRQVVQAAPDGYTLVIGNPGPMAVSPHTEGDLGFHPLNDLEPVGTLFRAPLVLVVRADSTAKNAKDLAGLMKASPKSFSFGSSGIGQSAHMAAQLMINIVGVDAVIVPYKGAPPAITDLLAGTIQAMFDSTTSMAHIQAGTLRAIAVSSGKRSALLPNVPTMAESGFQNFEIGPWFVLLAPAKTPRSIINRLNAVINATLESPAVKEQLAKLNAEPFPGTPEQARQFLKSEYDSWALIVKRLGAQAVPK